MYSCWVYTKIQGFVTFEYLPAVVGCLWFVFFFQAVCFIFFMSVTGIIISLSELAGARAFNCWCVVELLGVGEGTEACFYHGSVNVDRTYCFILAEIPLLGISVWC